MSRGRQVTIWEDYETDIDAYPLERTDRDSFMKWCRHRQRARDEAKSAGDDKKMARMLAAPYVGMAREAMATYDPHAWRSPSTIDMCGQDHYCQSVWARHKKGRSLTPDQKKLVAVLEKKKADGQWQAKGKDSVVVQSSPNRVAPVGPEKATAVVHVRKAPFDVYIGRDFLEFKGIGWGNPFKVEPGCGWKCVSEKYEAYVRSRPDLMARLPELKGKALGCWCTPRKHCHGDVLVKLVNETLKDG
jgi:hypothetical protein